jgi:hypothetical protein
MEHPDTFGKSHFDLENHTILIKTYIMRPILTCIFCFISYLIIAQDTLKVHFLYGSKPLKQYKHVEEKWFGGILGGHAGIERDNGKILNFLPIGQFNSGRLHLFAHKNNKRSAYLEHTYNPFYEILGGNSDSAKKAIVYIPITLEQKQKLDSIATIYLKEVPYDYAFFGMRCGAATYELLGQLNILPNYGYTKTWIKIFYPKKLRRQLFKKAVKNNWKIIRNEGSIRRKWEKD